MSNLSKTQTCPYCEYEVDDPYAEWEEGTHSVTCDSCNKGYQVTTHYRFEGFEVEKMCQECFEPMSECFCEGEEPNE